MPTKPAGSLTLPVPTAERALTPRDSISVLTTAQVPASLRLDGELGEWGVFAAGTPTELTPSVVAAAVAASIRRRTGIRRTWPEGAQRVGNEG